MTVSMKTNVGMKGESMERPHDADARKRDGVTRRSVLAASGLVALIGMAGCVDRVAATVTNTTSSPAAAMSGATLGFRHDGRREGRAYDVGNGGVEHVPAKISADSGSFSASVTLDGWRTDEDVVAPANDYNSVRSNKRRSAAVPFEDPDGDDDTDDSTDGDTVDGDANADEDVSEDLESLYAYLGDEPVIGERFTVCLPDARLPRGGPAVVDEITPRRIVEYLTGQAASCGVDAEDTLWCWGDGGRGRSETTFSEQPDGERGVATYAMDGGVCVAGVPGDAGDAAGLVALAPEQRDGSSPARFTTVDADPDGWGGEEVVGDVAVSPTFVLPIVARPADAPVPFYALCYFTRCRHGDEYLYTGGWLIDDAAVHEDSCTLLVAEESCPVMAVTPEDVRNGDAVRRKARELAGGRRRRGRGAVVYDGAIDEEALEYLPDALGRGEGLDGVVSLVEASSRSARTGRNPQTGKEIQIPARDGPVTSDDATAMRCVMTAIDCPVAHLVEADDLDVAEKTAAFDAFLKIAGLDE